MATPLDAVSVLVKSADVCIQAGRKLYSRYKTYKDAEQDLIDLTWQLKNHFYTIESKMLLIKDLQDIFEHSLRQHFEELFEILDRKIAKATRKIESVDRSQSRAGRAKFAALVKDNLLAALAEFEKWQKQMELSYFLIIRINNPRVDEGLNRVTSQSKRANESAELITKLRSTIKSEPRVVQQGSIFLPPRELERGMRPIDSYTDLKLVSIPGKGGRDFLVDVIVIKGIMDDGSLATSGIRDMARILQQAEPFTFGILSCHGVVKEEAREGSGELVFNVVFAIPATLSKPMSLRNYLAAACDGKRTRYPLNERFDLAKRLARSVMFVHASNLVHKNIRPETVVIFQTRESLLGTPFLVGFQKIRAINAATMMVGDAEWEKDLYRHPTRQGLKPEDTYKMQHDIYSLGVCLLEIGLWTSFVMQDERTGAFIPGPDLPIAEFLAWKDQRKKALEVKAVLLGMATQLLPAAMGPKYAEVVISCLTCLDKENRRFGSEEDLRDEDGIVVGVKYVEIVAMKLEEIAV